ncbi:MAG: tyrosinase family protein [Azoarcus sp.]|nr:tyrosinase family protein [Azoarcus sp.]
MSKIEAAIQEMMDRSDKDKKDPRGWLANAEPHNAFCAATDSRGFSQIHFCYWFLPWHRAYLAITERKIREIAGDASLAFPYWNWSIDRRIPTRFSTMGSSLSKAVRFTPDRELESGEVDYIDSDSVLRKLGVAALAARKFVATPFTDRIALARELRGSFGGLARPNALERYGNSRIEGTPHGPVHVYVGGVDDVTGRFGDMTDFATAGRDPIFFSHHGNIDRLWENWRSNPSQRAAEPNDRDFLEHKFVFPWLDGSSIEVACSETLDTTKLGYTYDSLEVVGATGGGSLVKEGVIERKRLPAVVDSIVNVPATPEAFAKTSRYVLIISGVESPGRPMSAGVYVAPRGQMIRKVFWLAVFRLCAVALSMHSRAMYCILTLRRQFQHLERNI